MILFHAVATSSGLGWGGVGWQAHPPDEHKAFSGRVFLSLISVEHAPVHITLSRTDLGMAHTKHTGFLWPKITLAILFLVSHLS